MALTLVCPALASPELEVNGDVIAKGRIADMLAAAAQDGAAVTPALRQRAIDSAIQSVLIEQAARRRGLLDRPHNRFALAEARASLIAELLKQDVTEQAVARATDHAARVAAARSAQQPRREYLLRQIVVADDATARAVLARLQGGAPFGELARAHSLDEFTRLGGGYRSWADGRDLPPALLQAVESLAPGALLATPLVLDDGWHVVQLIERREWPLGNEAERDEWAELTVQQALQDAAWASFVKRLQEQAVIRTVRRKAQR